MGVKEYSLKLRQLSEFVPTIVANLRARMNFFYGSVYLGGERVSYGDDPRLYGYI